MKKVIILNFTKWFLVRLMWLTVVLGILQVVVELAFKYGLMEKVF